MELNINETVMKVLRSQLNQVVTLDYVVAQTKLTRKQAQRGVNYLCQNRSVADDWVIEIIKKGVEWRLIPINGNVTQSVDEPVTGHIDHNSSCAGSSNGDLYVVIGETSTGLTVMENAAGDVKKFKEVK